VLAFRSSGSAPLARAGLAGVLLLTLLGAPVHAASKTVTVQRVVSGAQTARFTVTRANEIRWGVKADRTSPLFGWTIARVGSDPYAVELVPEGLGAGLRMSLNFEPHGAVGVLLPPGTYDLTLYSQSAARIAVEFGNPLPALRFLSRQLQTWTATSSDPHPIWHHDFPVGLTAPPHGAVVYMHDEWFGDGRNSQTACVWQATACAPVGPEGVDQLAGSDDGLPGHHDATYGLGLAGAEFRNGGNTVSVQSVVAGGATRRAAIVLVVP